MRRSPRAELRYWSDSFPLDLTAGIASGALAAALAAPAAFFAAMHFFAHSRTLEVAEHRSASAFLALLAGVVAWIVTAIAVFLIRYFRRLYRDPL